MTDRKSGKGSKVRRDDATFESALRRLEAIVESLESGEVPLEKAVALYEEGIALSKQCSEKLRATELRLKKLGKDANGQFTLTDLEE